MFSDMVPPQDYSFYQLYADCMDNQISRKGMWEPQYSEGMFRTTGKPIAKRDQQNHASYRLLTYEVRAAEKEAKMGFQSEKYYRKYFSYFFPFLYKLSDIWGWGQ